MVENSVIFELESGFDDKVGQNIKKLIFNDNIVTFEFSNILQVESKIIEIINNMNCKYKINHID